MERIRVEFLESVLRKTLQRRGLSEEHIDFVVQGLIETSLRGIDTHGIRLFETYIKELDNGRSVVAPQIKIMRRTPATIQLDAGNALGIVAGMAATGLAIDSARDAGIAAVTVCNSNHFGAASNYTLHIAKAGMIGMCFSNADALVAPHNGRYKLFGTNPISFAVAAESGEMFCLDMATSQISFSKVMHHVAEGVPLQPGWAIDNDGVDAASGSSPSSLLPLGGYKGQGLGMMVQILAGLLTGMPFDHEMKHVYSPPYDVPGKVGHFVLALNIDHFTNSAMFRTRLAELLETTRGCDRRTDEPVRVPGDLEREETSRRRKIGIPLTDKEYGFFQECARALGLAWNDTETADMHI